MRKIRTVDTDLFPNHWLLGGAFDAPDPNVPGVNFQNHFSLRLRLSAECFQKPALAIKLKFRKRRAQGVGIKTIARYKRKISK